VKTGIDGEARMSAPGGYSVSMKPSSDLETATRGPKESPLLLLRNGLMHALSGKGHHDGGPTFMTRSAVAAVRGTEFLMTASTGNLTGLSMLSGEVDLTASEKKIDLEAVKPWWNEPWPK
ncbi:MAG: FecR domain-containing protein, partial [Elusimicrobiota bacterium]